MSKRRFPFKTDWKHSKIELTFKMKNKNKNKTQKTRPNVGLENARGLSVKRNT